MYLYYRYYSALQGFTTMRYINPRLTYLPRDAMLAWYTVRVSIRRRQVRVLPKWPQAPIHLQHCAAPRKWRGLNGRSLRPKEQNSKARRAETDGFLGGLGSAVSCKLPSGVWGKTLATWQFKTSYRLTKPLLASILLVLNFSDIFVGSEP